MTNKIEFLELSLLRPPARNANTHSPKQIQQIANSIKRFGFLGAIIVGEDNEILAGSGRAAAARLLGMTIVPTIRASKMSRGDKRAFALVDNKTARNAGLDVEILAIELAELTELGIPLPELGFEQPEIDQILIAAEEASPKRKLSRDDDCPAFPDTVVSQPGDTWLLGDRHRLSCGDAADVGAVERLMNGASAQAIFADPPYNVRLVGHATGLGGIRHREFTQASGDLTRSEFIDWLTKTLGPSVKHCKDGAIAFTCMDWRHLQEILTAGEKVFTELKNLCVWVKSPGMGQFYRSQHELILVWKIGTGPHINTFGLGQNGRSRTNVWTYPGMASFGPDRLEDLSRHPTPKAVALVVDAIRDVTHRGDLVLDPFGGSGTTLIAAHKCGRTAHLMELDPGYCDVIIERFRKLTGKVAVLESSGLNFDAVAAERALTVGVSAAAPPPPSLAAWAPIAMGGH